MRLLMALIPMLLFRSRSWQAYMACFAGVLSHLLLDWTNTYGIRMLLPFSSRWLHLDITDVVDPWILLALLVAPSAPAQARSRTKMVYAATHNERGVKARRSQHRSRHRRSCRLAVSTRDCNPMLQAH